MLHLAHFLRYMLYESQAAMGSLRRETEIITYYLSLQRTIQSVDVSCTIRGDVDGLFVAPLSLFPLVERAFHPLTRLPATNDAVAGDPPADDPTWISIDLAVEATYLTLKVISGQPISQPDEVNWLADVRKQLLYYYAGDFDLQMRSEPDMHLVSLQLPLARQSDWVEPQPKPGNSRTIPATRIQ